MYNFNIKKGCNKAISLLFKDLGNTELNKLFTSEWNDDVLLAIFGTFKEYFNAGFYKLLKTQNNLLIIVRAFIDNFVCYYIEEIIHCVRSLNRKTLKSSSTPKNGHAFMDPIGKVDFTKLDKTSDIYSIAKIFEYIIDMTSSQINIDFIISKATSRKKENR